MSSYFHIHEHKIPCQHIRALAGGTRRSQDEILYLAVKHYVPVDRVDPVPENAVTIIGVHGNGFMKELYEPFMETLYQRLHSKGIHVRGVWMADNSNQGASGVFNETTHGQIIDYSDHARDLLLMTNHFRHEMPRPLVGFAHSYGCPIIIQLSLLHPRLLSTLILCEPIIFNTVGLDIPMPGGVSSQRPDLWKTREEAEQRFRSSLKRQNWDERVIDRYLKHGLRNVPTAIYDPEQDPKIPKSAVTLTTTKHQEVWSFIRLNLGEENETRDRILKPDQSSEDLKSLAARPELNVVWSNLPHIRPSVLYTYGGKSRFTRPEWRKHNYEFTGTGVGGSGGANIGKVKQHLFKGANHLLPCEKGQLEEFADVSADWLKQWYQEWKEGERVIQEHGRPVADASGLRLSKQSYAALKLTLMTPRSANLTNKL